MSSIDKEYDLVVIGGGSGGVRAARLAGQSGAKVALVEAREMGGTCVNRGCVPKKFFAYASRFRHDIEDAAAYGWDLGKPDVARFDWPTLRDNVQAEVERLTGLYQGALDGADVEVIAGFARLSSGTEVDVELNVGGCQKLKTKRILVAVGGKPVVPDVPGKEHWVVSDDLFSLERFPKSIVVVGGGYIGVEVASFYAQLGVETHLVHRGETLFRGFDDEVSRFLASRLELEGLHLHFGTSVTGLYEKDGVVSAHLDNGKVIRAELHCAAVGRSPLTEGIGLEEAGVELDERGHIVVDEKFQSSVSSVFALGDVIGRLQLTPVAIAEAIAFVHNEFGVDTVAPIEVAYEQVPTAVFSTPELGTVGLSEGDMLTAGRRARIYTSEFRPLKQSLSKRNERDFFKLVVDDESGKVVGAHLVGARVAEMLQVLGVCVRAGVTKEVFDATIGIHPTAAEEIVQMRSPKRIV